MPSICRDFERLCQAALDRRVVGEPGLGQALDSHASACPACLPIYSRYVHLRQAIAALSPTIVPEDFADRAIRAFAASAPPRTIPLRIYVRVASAIAASLLIAGAVAVRFWPTDGEKVEPVVVRADFPRPLDAAISEATAETIGLAREASAPAARVGRQVIRSASIPPMTWGLAFSTEPAVEVLQSVGDEVGAGVRPLSGSARSAFGFLIPGGSKPDRPGPSTTEKQPKGT